MRNADVAKEKQRSREVPTRRPLSQRCPVSLACDDAWDCVTGWQRSDCTHAGAGDVVEDAPKGTLELSWELTAAQELEVLTEMNGSKRHGKR